MRSGTLDETWQAATQEDIEWVLNAIDRRWFRLRMLVALVGPGHELNVSKIAKELGCSRSTVDRLISQVRTELRKKDEDSD